jgi:hypothetical protein
MASNLIRVLSYIVREHINLECISTCQRLHLGTVLISSALCACHSISSLLVLVLYGCFDRTVRGVSNPSQTRHIQKHAIDRFAGRVRAG